MFIHKDETEEESFNQIKMRIENHLYTNRESEPNFTLAELTDKLNNLKMKKAPGIDMISCKVLKLAVQCNPPIIRDFLNACLKFACFPEILKISVIV